MSFTYFKFLFINTAKRKSVWITWLLFAFTCISFIILLPLLATMNTLQVWANTTMSICQTFMGMVAGLFTAVLAIGIFKDTNEEGTELIVISKPISRFKIVMSKFVVFGAFCLLVNISTVLITMFTAFLPRTEPQFYVGLLVSMFIGNAITFAIFGSISVLLTLNFAKVGIIITNVIISLAFLIYQALTLFVFSTPLKVLNDQNMSAASYIIHDRDTTTGEYKENEVVYFEGTPLESGKPHPCQATNWREMKDYWEKEILPQDPTPILNATDWASQLALTYLSYNTNRYADRQANRMFSFTRYYNYELTSPASPEITEEIDNKQNLQWLYYLTNNFDLPGVTDPLIKTLVLPKYIGFDGIPPITGTRLRGYGDQIPIGFVRSKELLDSREVYFEKEQWNKYAPLFDIMYKDVFDYRNYITTPSSQEELTNLSWAFAWDTTNLRKYYNAVWACLTGNADDERYMNPAIDTKMKDYDATSFDIHNIDDLNDRFIQFKNYVFWKALEEQQKRLNGTDNGADAYEEAARADVFDDDVTFTILGQTITVPYNQFFTDYLNVSMNSSGSWMSKATGTSILAEINTQFPNISFINQTWNREYPAISGLSQDEKIAAALNSTNAIYNKTSVMFVNVCETDENYLFVSLDSPTRSWAYTGKAYVGNGNWSPNINEMSKILGGEITVPIGQNMQWFFYSTTPRLKYWVFAIIWGSIALGLFATGIVLYNKFDVK